jgi:RimJ/RimL family protein N-acetyltransferase
VFVNVRQYRDSDWSAVLAIVRAALLTGDTYALAPESTDADIHRAWIELPTKTFVAYDTPGLLLGTYFIKPNQPGLGSHVCNCGYIVAAAARGRGVASRMCEHSQAEAIAMGFRAMQFNLVVATNERAVRLWERLGFAVVGRLPGAFQHRQFGYVDALVMYKSLAM